MLVMMTEVTPGRPESRCRFKLLAVAPHSSSSGQQDRDPDADDAEVPVVVGDQDVSKHQGWSMGLPSQFVAADDLPIAKHLYL